MGHRFKVSSDLVSFHRPLSRYLALLCDRLSTTPCLDGSHYDAVAIATAASEASALCDPASSPFPIVMLESAAITLAMVAEIRARLWVRSGECVSSEAYNYYTPAQSLLLRDLDIKVLQVCVQCVMPLRRCRRMVR